MRLSCPGKSRIALSELLIAVYEVLLSPLLGCSMTLALGVQSAVGSNPPPPLLINLKSH